MVGFAEVQFKGTRKDYFSHGELSLHAGDYVLVEADRGQDLGWVTALGTLAQQKCEARGGNGCGPPGPENRILRLARPEEVQRLEQLRSDENRVRTETRKHVERHGLKMKVTEAEWQFDRNKLIIYFTAERRVDFRELVRDLARSFRTRIELRQIGVRDEAALLGGVGRCGREQCSSIWLPELKPVSLQLAKDQSLSLNPAQISGNCGRLMCCLRYEHENYLEMRRRFPKEGKLLRTSRGKEKVLKCDIWGGSVTLRDSEGSRRTLSLDELKEEVSSASRRRGSDPAGSGSPAEDEGS